MLDNIKIGIENQVVPINNELRFSIDVSGLLRDSDIIGNGPIHQGDYILKLEFKDGFYVDENNKMVTDLTDLYDENGKIDDKKYSYVKIECKIQEVYIEGNLFEQNTLELYNKRFVDILEKSNYEPYVKRLKEFENEIKRVSDFLQILELINYDELNDKKDHYNYNRFMKNNNITTSVNILPVQYLTDNGFKKIIDNQLNKHFNEDQLNNMKIEKKFCILSFIKIKEIFNAYLIRLNSSYEKIKNNPHLMSNIYDLSDIEHKKFIDVNHVEYLNYLDKYLANEHTLYSDIYFIKYNLAQGIIKDSVNQKVYKASGYILVKSKNGEKWNIFFFGNDEIDIDNNKIKKHNDILGFEKNESDKKIQDEKNIARENKQLKRENKEYRKNERNNHKKDDKSDDDFEINLF